jgi:hypothetical protein
MREDRAIDMARSSIVVGSVGMLLKQKIKNDLKILRNNQTIERMDVKCEKLRSITSQKFVVLTID